MGPIEAIKSCFRNYATFSGRAVRSEFWWFWGICLAATWTLSTLGMETLSALLWLASLIPFLAVAWRRMHDTDRSGAVLLLPLATMLVGVYVNLFAMLAPYSKRMAEMVVTPDTTIGELQNAQFEALKDVVSPGPSLWALVVIGAALLWLVYLLTQPTKPGLNRFGPPPTEVTP